MCPKDLRTLPPDSLRAVADYLRSLADDLDKLAETATPPPPSLSAITAHQSRLFASLAIVENFIRQGMMPSLALRATAEQTGLDPLGLEVTWNHRQRSRTGRRAVVIDYLTEAGLKDDEIGAIVGLHPKSVSRNRKSRKPPPADPAQPDLFRSP